MKKTATHKRLLSLLMAAVMILSMLPVFQREVSAESTVLLNETVDLAASAAAKDTYWAVDFKAGKTYTITAQWASSPKFSGSGTTVATAWKLSTVPSNTVQSGGDVIFWASLKPKSSVYAAKGYQAVFTPTQDMPYLDFYYQNYGAEANSFTIKVEEGNTLNTTIAADQELVYDSYITAAGGTTYLNAYIGLPLQAGTTYNVTASHPSAPGYTDAGTGSGWKVVTAPEGNTENQGENIITVLRNAGATALTSQTAEFTPATTHPFLNFFTQKCGSNDRTIHITVTKDKTIVPGEDELAISILGDSISTYTGISSGAAASTTNSTIANNAVYYSAGRFDVYQADTWWQQAADALGAKVLVNNAYSGSCVLTVQDSIPNAYDDRCVQLHDDTGTNSGEEPDIIAVYLGTNDYCRFPSTLGKAADINYETLITANGTGFDYATPTTTAEAYAIMIHKMTQRYPNAEIYCFTVLTKPDMTTELTEQIEGLNTSIKAIANKYGAYVVDLYNDSGIEDDAFFQTYVPKTDGKNILHPGPAGMDAITNCFLSAIYANSEIADIDNDTTYSVSYDLTDTAVVQGTAKVVPANKAFSCDVIAASGYSPAVQVTMGGTDITATACADGKVTISEVTGNVEIKATAEKLPAQPAELDKAVNVTTATDALYYEYAFESGKAYKVTATWASDPSFPSGQKGWSLTTGTTSADGDLVVLANTGITYGAKVAKSAAVIFTATEDASKLYLNTAGITEDNSLTVTVEPATAEAGLVVDVTVTIPAGTRYTNVYTDAVFTANEKYDYSVRWTNQPTYSVDGKRAWKIQPATNSSVDGSGGDWYVGPMSASGVSDQTATGTQISTVDKPVFNLFTQYLQDENTVHITVKKVEDAVIQIPYDILDEVSIAKSYSVAGNANGLCGKAGCTEGHPMQSFDVYDGILFVSYDAGYVITYDLETGAKLSGFLMGCGEYSHDHHCGNCMFGTAKFDPNDRFPLLYSSGDLTTKDCYVERILTDSNGIPIGSKMVQRIDFDMGEFAGANGAQAVVDPANNRIIFQQREKSSISKLDSAFVMGEYPLPAHTEGTLQPDGSLLVEYDTGDFLVPAYKLPYWSPMYQGADYFENLFLQTHGPTINGFGSGNGVMVFDYNTPGHDFTRYIAMGPVVGVYEPQGVSVCDGKLYMSYGGAVHELAVKLGVKETGYDLANATDAAGIKTFVETEVTKQLTDGGKGYTLKNVEVKSITATGFTADVTVKTPYTIQTFAVSGNMNVPTTDIPAGNSTTYFDQTFKAGKAYIVTLDWTDVPSFTGSQAGYTLQTTDKQNAGDLVLTTMNKIAGDTSKAVSLYSGLFIPTKDMTALELKVTGMDAANKAVVTVVETTAEDDILFDGTVSLEGGAGFTNSFFPVEFVTGERYAVTATWKDQPTYGGVSTAWKVQPATSTTLEGNSDQRFAWVKTTDGDAALKGYSGNVTAAMDGDYLNVFTQGLTAANEMHVTVKKLPAADADTDAFVASQLGQETAVADNKSNVFAYNFQAGKAYKVTATWKNTPAFSGSDGGWNLRAIGSATSDDTRELVFKAMTDGSDSAVLPKSFVGTFRPTQDLSHLKLATQGLTGNDNAITVTVEEVTLPETTVFEGKLSVESNQKRLDAYAGLDFDGDKNYKVTVAFDDEIVHYSNAYATAWGMQLAGSEYLTSAKADAYVTETSANNVGSRGFTYVFDPAEDISTFHFFLNKVKNANNVSIKIEETSEPQTGTVVPDFIRDSVTITKLPVTGGGQGFDIWNGVMFQCQDAGYCKTYDLATGAQLGSFALGSQYSHNHCGNANFGTQYPTGNTEYPALYVSGDLTTKACYVENVTETSSELIQTIYFDIDPSYTGGQVILDRERNVLLYQQRQQPGIRDSLNYFKVYEFPVPKLSDGAEIRYDNDDVLKAYDLYFTTLYQGATLQNGLLLQTHGPCANAFNSSVGVMAFNVEKGVPERHIDLTSLKYEEPQGITVYDNRLIMSFADGSYYQIELNMNFKQTGYVIPCAANEAALKEAIAKAVEAELEKDAKTKGFTVAEVKLTTSTRAAGFTAEVTVETAYTNHQTYTVSGTVGEHSFTNYVSNGNATCTADGTKTATCDNGCGLTDTVTDVGSKGHKLEKVAYKAPTTQAEGNIEHYACQGCGKLYNDDKATKELTKAETVLEKLPEPTTEPTTAPTTEPTTAPTTTPTTAPTTPATGEGYPIALMVWLMLGSVLALVVTMKRRSV